MFVLRQTPYNIQRIQQKYKVQNNVQYVLSFYTLSGCACIVHGCSLNKRWKINIYWSWVATVRIYGINIRLVSLLNRTYTTFYSSPLFPSTVHLINDEKLICTDMGLRQFNNILAFITRYMTLYHTTDWYLNIGYNVSHRLAPVRLITVFMVWLSQNKKTSVGYSTRFWPTFHLK